MSNPTFADMLSVIKSCGYTKIIEPTLVQDKYCQITGYDWREDEKKPGSKRKLDKMTKADLELMANDVGLEPPARISKGRLAEMIADKMGLNDGDVGGAGE